MARTDTTEGQALRQPGGAEEDSRFREGDKHLRLACDEEEEEERIPRSNNMRACLRINKYYQPHFQEETQPP